MIDADLDLLLQAQSMQCDSFDVESEFSVTDDRRWQLVVLASKQKRLKIEFFNFDNGVLLSLHIPGQTPKQSCYGRCTLCKQHTKLIDCNGKPWNGLRTTIACSICAVQLCLWVHSGLRKCCWSVWPSANELTPRNTPFLPRELPNKDNTEDNELQTITNQLDDRIPGSTSHTPPGTFQRRSARINRN